MIKNIGDTFQRLYFKKKKKLVMSFPDRDKYTKENWRNKINKVLLNFLYLYIKNQHTPKTHIRLSLDLPCVTSKHYDH